MDAISSSFFPPFFYLFHGDIVSGEGLGARLQVRLTFVDRLGHRTTCPLGVVLNQVHSQIGVIVGYDVRHCIGHTLAHFESAWGNFCFAREQVGGVVNPTLTILIKH